MATTSSSGAAGDEGSGGDKRPSTPYDYHRLDSLRSHDNDVTVPLPRPVSSEQTTTFDSPRSIESAVTPLTPPDGATPSFTFPSDGQPKRDSAIDHCSPRSQSQSLPHSLVSGLQVVAESPSLPSIVVHDAGASSPQSSKNSRRFFRKFSKDTDDSPIRQPGESTQSHHQRLRSFHGIEVDLSSDSGLEDLSEPDKLKFSNRGSVLLNGKKLDAMFAAQENGTDGIDGIDATDGTDGIDGIDGVDGIDKSDTDLAKDDTASIATPEAPGSPLSQLSNTPSKGTGLRTGRRTPSVHMLQAVMQGSRVLSAEEVTFSQRVRTMYEYGDEKAAQWTMPGSATIEMPPPITFDTSFSRDGTPEPEGSAMTIDNPRRRPQTEGGARAPHPELRMSYIAREPNETAGGIEDWEEVPSGAVDRYGFIQPSRIFSGDTIGDVSFAPSERPGMQRVTTSLQQLSNNPRQPRHRIFRSPSARYSRSMPPARAPSRQTVRSNGPANSIYSYQSNHSNTKVANPFRSRDRRALDEAPDMLTLPPYLANINESETPSSAPAFPDIIKRREWTREGKWRKMAHLVPSTVRGAGMKFEFNVSDPKLVDRAWKGIPDRWRATAWHSFLSSSARKRGNFPSDDALIRLFGEYQEESSADDVQIDVDVPRTINLHIMFRRRYRGGQRLLFRVLHAISIHFPETGYVQGMAALAATLLCYFDEEMAFVMLVRMWQLRGLEELYRSGFEGLMAALDEFRTQWLSNDVEIAEKLTELGIDPTSYGTRWYLTLFNMSIPFPAQLRIWDVYMLLGDAPPPAISAIPHLSGSAKPPSQQQNGLFGGADLSVLHAASSALVEAMRGVLLDCDFEIGMKALTSWVPVQDEDLLMKVAKAEYKIGMKNRRRERRAVS